jgi:hypothetical protein
MFRKAGGFEQVRWRGLLEIRFNAQQRSARCPAGFRSHGRSMSAAGDDYATRQAAASPAGFRED